MSEKEDIQCLQREMRVTVLLMNVSEDRKAPPTCVGEVEINATHSEK